MRALKDADRNNEPLDAVLRRAMREPPGAATPECADAESIAAYFDGSIVAAERERLEAHFADCARCQTQLAAIARADESARAASAASKAPWYRRWQFAIPAFAAAAAVAVFIAIRRPGVEQSSSTEVVAMAKREAPAANLSMPEEAPVPAAPIASPALSPSIPKQLAMNEPKTLAPSRAEAKSAPRLHRMETGVEGPGARAPAPAPVEAPAGAGRVVAIAPAAPFVAPGSATKPAASASSEVAMNQPQADAAQRAEARGYAPQALSERAVPGTAPMVTRGGAVGVSAGAPISPSLVGAAPPAPTVASPSAGSAVGAVAVGAGSNAVMSGEAVPSWTAQVMSAVESGIVRIATPEPNVWWIAGKGGLVQRRNPDSRIHVQHSGVTTDLTAGAAPSASVCWIVGRSGTIIRTTDGGEHWELITPPVTENIATVWASSANDATIATASGRRFATSDGGESWRAL